jgi:hypothetical protein
MIFSNLNLALVEVDNFEACREALIAQLPRQQKVGHEPKTGSYGRNNLKRAN